MGEKFDTIYICDWLPPDFGAVGQYSLVFARELAREGKRVILAGLSSQGNSVTVSHHGEGYLKIIKLAARPYKKTDFKSRISWTVKVNSRLVFRLWPELLSCDEIVFTGSPPLFLHWIAPLNLILGKRLTYRITDFHPECLIAARCQPSWWLELVYRITLFWRRRVQTFEVLGEDQRERLREIGIDERRIRIKPDGSPVTIAPDTAPLAWPAFERGQRSLLYSGNWGVAHDYETFLQAYRHHHQHGSGRMVLWLNAVGAAVEPVETFLRENALPYRRSYPVPIEKLANLLVTPDAHLITLSDAFIGFVLPSKVHGCVASNKAILYVGSDRSDVHRLCAAGAAHYQRVPVGDVDKCAAALERLADVFEQ